MYKDVIYIKKILIIMATILLSLTLVACSSKDSSNEEEIEQVDNYDIGEIEEDDNYYEDDYEEELYIEEDDYEE